MSSLLFALLLAVPQESATPPAQDARESSPIARLVVHPEDRTMIAGDTLRLRAEAFDAEGNPVPNVTFQYMSVGGGAMFEATVDETGLIRSAATGTVPVGVAALAPNSAPVVERVDIEMVPGPAARIEVSPEPARLVVGQRRRLSATSYSATGDERSDEIEWSSSSPEVVQVTRTGLATASSPGEAVITAGAGDATEEVRIEVAEERIATVEVTPSETQAKRGDVIPFEVTPRDESGREIEGVTPTWSFSPGHGMITPDGKFVGYHAGEYLVTASFGERSADAIVEVEHRDVRRPLSVVGRLGRELFTTEEVWVHPNGEVAYLGTGRGGDRLYVIDISNPAEPFVTDSLVADTRRVNDNMTTEDGRFLVHTREGASSRRNGIVIASLEDPRHPEVIAEFTDGVTAGVHSAFVYTQPEYGTHVYATNNGNNSLDIIDITDPYNPARAGRFKINELDAGNYLHDVDVQDGLAYLSYWNEGLVIVDVGAGIKGGSPSDPQIVSQYKYDLNELYRDVEASGGPGFIRGTHTAWRYGDYVFIADEVFPAAPPTGTKDAAAERAYGRLQVVDVSDIEDPRSVAWYEPEFGGVHNVWVEDDKLYIGAYNAGFRIFDVSGELLGDLREQAREIGHLNSADMDGIVPNAAMTWGVVVKDGLAYVNDLHNGLWIVRIEEEGEQEPLIP